MIVKVTEYDEKHMEFSVYDIETKEKFHVELRSCFVDPFPKVGDYMTLKPTGNLGTDYTGKTAKGYKYQVIDPPFEETETLPVVEEAKTQEEEQGFFSWLLTNETEQHTVNKWIFIGLALVGSALGAHQFYARHYIRGMLLVIGTMMGGFVTTALIGVMMSGILYIWYPTDAYGNIDVM